MDIETLKELTRLQDYATDMIQCLLDDAISYGELTDAVNGAIKSAYELGRKRGQNEN